MQTKLDQIANQNHLQLFKALLPHLPQSNQKTFSILIKTIEMRNVMDYYNLSSDFAHRGVPAGRSSCGLNETQGDLYACAMPENQNEDATEDGFGKASDDEKPPDLLDILTDIRQYCEGEELEWIDQALQMMSMIELYRVCAESESIP
ncbi:MAG: hypothetical protein LUD18_01185 [Lachnospiraceae bacterium]|nr:hypothetical protein [Lachnospiraceae bacterium]